jgi:RHS repeat-associated protein
LSPVEASDAALDFEAGTLARRWLHSARVDEPLAFERYVGTTAGGSGAAREVFADRLGNVLSVADPATGVVSGTAVYDSFGGRTITGEAIRTGSTGREHDAESGLIHFRARAYDPVAGQFLQRDPIGFASGDLNLYAYVWTNPYRWTDPSGLSASTNAAAGSAQAVRRNRSVFKPVAAGVRYAVSGILLALLQASSGDNIIPVPGSNTPTGNTNDDPSEEEAEDDDEDDDCIARCRQLTTMYEVFLVIISEGMRQNLQLYIKQAKVYNSECVPKGYPALPVSFLR